VSGTTTIKITNSKVVILSIPATTCHLTNSAPIDAADAPTRITPTDATICAGHLQGSITQASPSWRVGFAAERSNANVEEMNCGYSSATLTDHPMVASKVVLH